MNNKERNRIKVMFINKRELLNILTGKGYINNIPDYTKIIDMREEHTIRRGFILILEHPSFPEVDEGMNPEMFYASIENHEKSKNRKLYFD